MAEDEDEGGDCWRQTATAMVMAAAMAMAAASSAQPVSRFDPGLIVITITSRNSSRMTTHCCG